MTRIAIIGTGSAHLAAALRMLDESAKVSANSVREFVLHSSHLLEQECWVAPTPRSDDPFAGGCRSKGEKKRAARERRMRGGF
jgi:hypothetical protein